MQRRLFGNSTRATVAIVLASLVAGLLASLGAGGARARAAVTHVPSHGDTSLIEERTWYVAEGCTRAGYDTYILVQNPDPEAARVTLEFQLPPGQSAEPYSFDLPANTRRTVHLNELPGLVGTDVSTRVTATNRVMVERSMYMADNGRGAGHDSLGSPCPYTGWYFAEGYTSGSWETWILIQNPMSQEAAVTMEFQLPSGATAPAHEMRVPGNTRASVCLDTLPGLESAEVSTRIKSSVPVVAERSMYFEAYGAMGSHSSLGINAPATDSFLAEGFTGGSFDTYVLLQNPGDRDAAVTLKFQVPGGQLPEETKLTVPKGSRRTVKLDEVNGLAATDVATAVTSDVPVVVERSMYFDYYGRRDGHCAEGVTPYTTWHFPEGYTGTGFDTWILLQNPTTQTASIRMSFQSNGGISIRDYSLELPAGARRSVLLNDIDGFPAADVATTVSTDVPVVAERALYFESRGRSGGTCSSGYRANELADNAVILDEESVRSLRTAVDSDDFSLRFARTTKLVGGLREGDVIIASHAETVPDGMLRRITGIKTVAGDTVLSTEQASITDAIKYGNFFGELDGPAGAGGQGPSRRADASLGYGFETSSIPVTLQHITPTVKVRLSGEIYVNLSIGWQWKWYPPWYVPYLKYFDFGNDMKGQVDLSAKVDTGTIGGSKTVFTKQLGIIDIGPLVFVPQVLINVGASGSVDSPCEFGVRGSLDDIDTGVKYDGSWGTVCKTDVSGSVTSFNPPSGGDFTVYVEEMFEIMLYDLVGPYISVREGPRFHINKSDNPWWTIDMRFWSLGGVDINVFGIIHIKWDGTIFDFNVRIAQAEYYPVLDSIQPASGNVWSNVTVNGSYFGSPADTSRVSFGGLKADIVSWADKQVVCQVPPGASGVVPVSVTTKGGTSRKSIEYSVVPWLDHLSAPSGQTGSTVTLAGSGFGPAADASFVRFGSVKAAALSWQDDRVSVRVPAGIPPATSITLTTAGGTSRALPFSVVPRLDAIAPQSGTIGAAVRISGTGFGPSRDASSVRFAGVPVTDFTAWSDTSVTCAVPAGISLVVPVAMNTAGGASNSLDFGVIPSISGIEPGAAQVYQPVTIRGNGFGPSRGGSSVAFGSTAATGYVSWSDAEIRCYVPPGAGGVTKVRVTTPGGTSPGATFNVVPTLSAVTPSAARVGDTVTLAGNAFNRDPSAAVSFGDVKATDIASWDYDGIVCKVPLGAWGALQVTVTNAAGKSNPVDFSVAPTIDFIIPGAAHVGDTVTVAGTAFGPVTAGGSVLFGGTAAEVASWSDTSIKVKVPGGVWGIAAVTVNTIGGTSSPVPFGVMPTLSDVSPEAGKVGAAVVLSGNAFGPEQADSYVAFGDVRATVTAWGDGSIACEAPEGISGVVPVAVTTDGGTSEARQFHAVPDISTVTPPGAIPDDLVRIAGHAFGETQGDSYVKFGEWAADGIVSWSDGEVACRVPKDASGEVRVTVTTEGGTSDGFRFDVVPFMSGITPRAGAPGGTLTVKGSGFGLPAKTSKVLFGQTTADVVSWSNNAIECGVPYGPTAGTVRVVTPGGVSNPLDFTVLTPTWFLAEGTCAWGFDTYLSIQNPNEDEVTARITYMTPAGHLTCPPLKLAPHSQTKVRPADRLGFKTDFSTRVDCPEGKSIAVDRTMTWKGHGAAGPEAHNSVGVPFPSSTWFLPEGASAYGFETWVLIQNPQDKEATCTVTYMIDGGQAKSFTKKVPAKSRRTYGMAADIGPASAGCQVESDVPVIAERAMYRNDRREGHGSIGTTLPAHNYFDSLGTPTAQDSYLAEGSTAHGFNTYLLLLNPGDRENRVAVTYMHDGGPIATEPFVMPPKSRKTIDVGAVLPGADFSIHVHGQRPVAAERAMYWTAGAALGEACHDAIGMTDLHDTFYFPDGQTSDGYMTYTCVQNPNEREVAVVVRYMTDTGAVKRFESVLPAKSRRTFSMADHVPSGRAAISVTCKNPADRVMAERSIYSGNMGAGTCSTGAFSDVYP